MRNQPEPSNFAAIKAPISQEALDQLFSQARTHSVWLPEPVPVELLRKAYELARLDRLVPTARPPDSFSNHSRAKALLKPVLAPGNVDKTMAAPVTVIIAWDKEFHEHLPRLFPQFDMRSYFVGNHTLITRPPSATVRCRLLISSWPHALWIRLRTDVRFRRR